MSEYHIELIDNVATLIPTMRSKPKDVWVVQRWWWRVVHRNGNILLTSETYARKATRTRIALKFAYATGLKLKVESKP